MSAALTQADAKTAARLACREIYDPITPGVFDKVTRINKYESVCGVKTLGGKIYIAMQGTESIDGWVHDFDALPAFHPVLGNLHAGFYANLPTLMVQTGALPVSMPIIVCGHSKGAAEGAILAALMRLRGYNVTAYLFACPNPGFPALAAYLQTNVPGTSYRNTGTFFADPVPLLPFEPYVPAYAYTKICVPPAWPARLLSAQWHHAALYAAAFS